MRKILIVSSIVILAGVAAFWYVQAFKSLQNLDKQTLKSTLLKLEDTASQAQQVSGQFAAGQISQKQYSKQLANFTSQASNKKQLLSLPFSANLRGPVLTARRLEAQMEESLGKLNSPDPKSHDFLDGQAELANVLVWLENLGAQL